MITTDHGDDLSVSGFLDNSFEGISRTFTDVEEIPTPGHNRLARAKRYGRWWMLKGLKPEAATQAIYQQSLRKELEVMLMMQHPGVVQAIGLERVQGLGDCIVMEYIDGTTLKEYLDGATTLAARRRVAGELAAALAYVHSLNIVHRDLKPENIMVTRNGQNVRIIDFGLADTDSHAVLKQPAGTASYMSPEQAQTAMPDVRNDLYSLGIIMRQMQLGRKYNNIIGRCLKPIDERWQNADELRRAIRQAEARRSYVKAATIAVAMVAMGAIVGVQTWRLHGADNDRRHIEQRVDSMRHQLATQQAESRRQQQRNEQQQADMAGRMAQSMSLLGDSIRRLTATNEQLQHELNRVSDAKKAALLALKREMKLTQVDRHIDTLTRWSYRWPDMGERIMRVNRFVYSYTDRLGGFTATERMQIREAMLNEWQEWNQHVSQLATTKYGLRSR